MSFKSKKFGSWAVLVAIAVSALIPGAVAFAECEEYEDFQCDEVAPTCGIGGDGCTGLHWAWGIGNCYIKCLEYAYECDPEETEPPTEYGNDVSCDDSV